MALGNKKGGTIHNKTGDAKNRLKAKYDAGDHRCNKCLRI